VSLRLFRLCRFVYFVCVASSISSVSRRVRYVINDYPDLYPHKPRKMEYTPTLWKAFEVVANHPERYVEPEHFTNAFDSRRRSRFLTGEGIIELYWDRHSPRTIKIFLIRIPGHLQRLGIFTRFVRQVLDDSRVDKLMIVEAEGYAIQNFMYRFVWRGSRFQTVHDGLTSSSVLQ
jgi:hypothetical protein